MGKIFYQTHFDPYKHLKIRLVCFNKFMSKQLNFHSSHSEINNSQSKVKVTDLLSRMNAEKKIEKKRNLALGVAAVSAVTVFGIILTI